MSVWVVNTSPLVFLGNLGRLELLRREGRKVCIPRAVADEVAEKPDASAQAVEAACAAWMKIRDVTNWMAVSLIETVLHKGEAEAIVLAIELQAERLVIDDQEVRRFADRGSATFNRDQAAIAIAGGFVCFGRRPRRLEATQAGKGT